MNQTELGHMGGSQRVFSEISLSVRRGNLNAGSCLKASEKVECEGFKGQGPRDALFAPVSGSWISKIIDTCTISKIYSALIMTLSARLAIRVLISLGGIPTPLWYISGFATSKAFSRVLNIYLSSSLVFSKIHASTASNHYP